MKEEEFLRARDLKYAIREVSDFILALEGCKEDTIRFESTLLAFTIDLKPFMAKDFIDAMLSLKDDYEREFREL